MEFGTMSGSDLLLSTTGALPGLSIVGHAIRSGQLFGAFHGQDGTAGRIARMLAFWVFLRRARSRYYISGRSARLNGEKTWPPPCGGL